MRLTLTQKLLAITSIGAISAIFVGGVGHNGLSHLVRDAEDLGVSTKVIRASMFGDMMHDGLNGNVQALELAHIKKDAEGWKRAADEIADMAKTFEEQINIVVSTTTDPEIAEKAKIVVPVVAAYNKAARDFASPEVQKAEKFPSLEAWHAEFEKVEEVMEKLGDAISASAEGQVARAEADAEFDQRMLILGPLFSILAAGLVSAWISRELRRNMREMADAAKAIARGDLQQVVHHESQDEIGELASSMRDTIAYVQELAAVLEGVSQGRIDRPMQPRSSQDVAAQNLNHVQDSLRSLLAETNRLIAGAREGHLEVRGDAGRLQGAYGELVKGFNQVLDAVQAPLSEVDKTLGHLASGDLRARMGGHYQGDFSRLQTAVNQMAEQLDGSVAEVASAAGQVDSATEVVATGSSTFARGASDLAHHSKKSAPALPRFAVSANRARTVLMVRPNSYMKPARPLSLVKRASPPSQRRCKASKNQPTKLQRLLERSTRLRFKRTC